MPIHPSIHSLRFLRSIISYGVSFDAQFYSAHDTLLGFAIIFCDFAVALKILDICKVVKFVVSDFCAALSSKKVGSPGAPYRNTKLKWGPQGRTHPTAHFRWARVLPPDNTRTAGAIREAKIFWPFLINFSKFFTFRGHSVHTTHIRKYP